MQFEKQLNKNIVETVKFVNNVKCFLSLIIQVSWLLQLTNKVRVFYACLKER